MDVRGIELIDREIASRADDVDAMSATLIEVEAHSGLAHLRRYTPVGITATRWAAVEPALSRLWADLNSTTSILESARAVRARRDRVGEADRAELTRLLFERPLEAARTRIPLAQRTITGRAEAVEYVGLADLIARMKADCAEVVEFLDAVDHVDSLIADGVGPLQDRLEAAGVVVPKRLVDLLAVSATDPLSLTPQEVRRRLDLATGDVELHVDWGAELQGIAARLDVLRDVRRRGEGARERVERTVLAGPMPVRGDPEPELREALSGLSVLDVPDGVGLRTLQHRVESALSVATDDEELAQGLLDRHAELAGRLTAYRAKAARLGLAEDRDLLAAGRVAADLLSRRPCDLRAVTRAVSGYQDLLAGRRETTS